MLAYQILHFSNFFYYLLRWVQKFNGLNIDSDFVKYLINSKKIQKKIKFDMQAHFNIYIILYIHIHILYYINFSYGHKKSGMKNVDPDYL